MRERVHAWTGGVAASVAACVGLLVGLRSVAAFEMPRPTGLLAVPPLPREGLRLEWSGGALWPTDMRTIAAERLGTVVVVLLVAAATVAALNAVVLLSEASAARRRELAVRAALGASPARLALELAAEIRTWLAAAVAFGVGFGVVGGGLLRVSWPGLLDPAGGVLGGAGDLLPVLAALTLLLGVAHVGVGLSVGRGRAAAEALRSGSRATSDAAAAFFRRVAPAVHAAVAGAVLVGTLALSASIASVDRRTDGDSDVAVLGLTSPAPNAWANLEGALADLPGLAAESLASPGAVVGLGIKDHVTTQCGPCSIGVTPTPLVGAFADVHAVSAGFFAMAGLEVLDGRPFGPEDRAGEERVAIVNETLARSSFHQGRPLGRQLRVGTGHDAWYTVIGVVEDDRWPTLGAEEHSREAVYLVTTQHAPRSARLLLAGTPGAVSEATNRLAALGFSPELLGNLAEVRSEGARVLTWLRDVSIVLAVITILLTAHGVRVTALRVTRRRRPELAVRRALGAGDLRIFTHVLGERLRVTLWGAAGMVFLGTLAIAGYSAAAAIDPPGPATYLAVTLLLVVVGLSASLRAAREALQVEPAMALE